MLLGGIKIAFLATVAALVVDVGALDGFACYAIGAALVLGAVVLFNAGCRVAARQEKQRILSEVTDVVALGHQDTRRAARAMLDHLSSEQHDVR